MKLRLVEKGPDGEVHDFLASLKEELKGIRKMLE
jgi:hypothetical protein